MATPILATKLYFPPPRPKVVKRFRLIERLNEGLEQPPGVTVISAPAGFGKTTLVSEWVTGGERPVAWLSLDAADSDPARFLAYLIAALQTIAPTIGAGVAGMPQTMPPPATEAILTGLLNEITTIADPFILVLDDYHVIEAKTIDLALTFLLEHLPPRLHLVIVTREDPQLPLARLRARDQLTELRAADLRFTPAEAAEFLKHVMGLNLSASDIAALEDRTEGWIAGLQLAALSMRGQTDIAGFVRAFAGDHRYIVDYLVEEVLQRQPEATRNLLLQTAILDRLNGPLCDAVTGQKDCNARLEALERGNFFVVPLDDQRHWYRYHHLFADVLRAHLMAEQPEQVSTLHRRASVWYEQHGSPDIAIRHALAAQDFERAAGLIELAVPAMRSSRQETTLLGWLKAIPDDLVRCRPVLSVAYAWALLTCGELTGVGARLRDAERWLDASADRSERPQVSTAGMVVVDEDEFRRLPGSIAVFRAALALAQGDVPGTVKSARRALDLVTEDNHLMRGAAASLLGLASWTSGDLEAAHQSYARGMAGMQRAGNFSDVLGCAVALAEIRIAQGRLHEAASTYERALQLATDGAPGTPVLRGTADLYVGVAELQLEHNDLNAAAQQLMRSQALGEIAGLPRNRYRWCVAMAGLRQTQGDLDGALDLLHEAERLYVSDYFPNVRPVAALRARVWVAHGQLSQAFLWARGQDLSADDSLSYLREFEHITLARALLARYQTDHADSSIDAVTRLLERLLQAADDGGRIGSVLEILVLQALVHQAQGDVPSALAPVERALTLAESESYVRIFVDEGPPMAALLAEAAKHRLAPNYVSRLLAAFGKVAPLTASRKQVQQALIEPLTERELDLLRLLGTNLSGPEIAQKLMVSLNTVRTHTRNIYTKLEVNDRRSAVRRADELGLM